MGAESPGARDCGVWGTGLPESHTRLVEHRTAGFEFIGLLFAFYFSRLFWVPFFLFLFIFLSPFGLREHFLFYFIFFTSL